VRIVAGLDQLATSNIRQSTAKASGTFTTRRLKRKSGMRIQGFCKATDCKAKQIKRKFHPHRIFSDSLQKGHQINSTRKLPKRNGLVISAEVAIYPTNEFLRRVKIIIDVFKLVKPSELCILKQGLAAVRFTAEKTFLS
jgi:hypothetical protein